MMIKHCTLRLILLAVNLYANSISGNKVLLISFDGFRWNYADDVLTPTLDKIAETGVKAKYVTPAMITSTGPTHYTLATGLYPESHGVIHNKYFNITTGEIVGYYQTCNDSRWYNTGVEPIWITAIKNGKKSGSFSWPGGTIAVEGVQVQYGIVNVYHNGSDDWTKRVDTTVEWLANRSVDFVALYFNNPDDVVHQYGIDSKQRKDIVKEVDRTVEYLLKQLDRFGLTMETDIIMTSDHGATEMNNQANQIELFKYINQSDIQFFLADYGPVSLIEPKDGRLEHVYNTLTNAHPNMTVYKKDEFPEFWHYARHPRIPSLIALADPGFVVYTLFPGKHSIKAEHGYDNRLRDMKAFFYAWGPSFKERVLSDPFETVNIYPLMCHLLNIPPSPNNGSLDVVKHLLKDAPNGSTNTVPFTLFQSLFMVFGILLSITSYT